MGIGSTALGRVLLPMVFVSISMELTSTHDVASTWMCRFNVADFVESSPPDCGGLAGGGVREFGVDERPGRNHDLVRTHGGDDVVVGHQPGLVLPGRTGSFADSPHRRSRAGGCPLLPVAVTGWMVSVLAASSGTLAYFVATACPPEFRILNQSSTSPGKAMGWLA